MRCAVGFLFSRLEAVLEQDAAVEDQMVCAAVAGVHAEIAYAHELEARCGLRRAALTLGIVLLCLFDERGFDLAAGQDRQGFRVQAVKEVQSTQWIVAPLTLRPSAGSPPRESGSYVA